MYFFFQMNLDQLSGFACKNMERNIKNGTEGVGGPSFWLCKEIKLCLLCIKNISILTLINNIKA